MFFLLFYMFKLLFLKTFLKWGKASFFIYTSFFFCIYFLFFIYTSFFNPSIFTNFQYLLPHQVHLSLFLLWRLYTMNCLRLDMFKKVIVESYNTQVDRENRTVALFRCKMAFLKWTFEADPVGVQKRTVSHFKGLE